MTQQQQSTRRKVRYAVVGLGWFSQVAVLPAFSKAGDNSELAALVTGDPEKARRLGEKYQVPAVSYQEYDRLLASGKIDAVYIVLPNSLHREYTERAARAGVNVLCEKPMAPTVSDCQAMINACTRAGVRLMIAYRLHFEESNLESIRAVQSGRIGEPRLFHSLLVQQVEMGNFRLDAQKGGGPLGDVGIYCINAARYLFRDEPTEVVAFATQRREGRFREVPEMVSALMRFPLDRLATFTCGFGESKVSYYQVVGTRGDLRLTPGYAWQGENEQVITVEGKAEKKTFEECSQVAAEILYFSDCVLTGKEPEPSGLEGLIDVRIIEALQQSSQQRQPITLERFTAKPRPTPAQTIERSPAEKPDLVHAAPPGGA
jgi:glucose-fructose oxidoreductase